MSADPTDVVYAGFLPVQRAGMSDFPHQVDSQDHSFEMFTSWTSNTVRLSAVWLLACMVAVLGALLWFLPQFFVFEEWGIAIPVYLFSTLFGGLILAKILGLLTRWVPRPRLALRVDGQGVSVGSGLFAPTFHDTVSWDQIRRAKIESDGLMLTTPGGPVAVKVLLFRDDKAAIERMFDVHAPDLRES